MKKIVVVSQFNEDCRRILREAAGDAEIIFSSPEEADAAMVKDAGMIVGPIPPALLPAAQKLEVLQLQSAGADVYIRPGVLPETVTESVPPSVRTAMAGSVAHHSPSASATSPA